MSRPLPFPTRWRGRFVLLFFGLLLVGIWVMAVAYHLASKNHFEVYAAELAAKGESLEIEDLRPPRIPNPEDNVAAAPVFSEFLKRLEADPEADPDAVAKSDPVWSLLDLSAIPGYASNRFPPELTEVRYLRSQPLWTGFETEEDSTAARTILEYADTQEVHLTAIREALARPGADFGTRYGLIPAISFGDLVIGRRVANLLHRQGRAALLSGRPDLAHANAIALLRLSRHLGGQFTLIHVLSSAGIHERGISLIHDGLAAGSWTDEQLTGLARELEILWLESSFLAALRMERAMSLELWRDLADGDPEVRKLFHDSWAHMLLWLPNLRRGWCYDNMEFNCRTMQERLLEDGKGNVLGDRIAARPVLPPVRTSGGSFLDQIRITLEWIRHGVADSSGSFLGIHQRVLRAQVAHDHARLAVALALHRSKHGAYPDTLALLTLPSGTAMPLDPFTGSSFVYQRVGGTDYLLYSLGPDGRDNGGQIRHRHEHGDWVWRLHLPEDFDYDAYRGR